MSPRNSLPPDESAPSFKFRRDGSGVNANWKTLGVAIAVAFACGGIFFTLEDHTKSIVELRTAVQADHDILLRLDAYITKPNRQNTEERGPIELRTNCGPTNVTDAKSTTAPPLTWKRSLVRVQ